MIFLSPDGTRLFCQSHTKKNSQAALLVVHGLGEHIGRYQDFLRQLKSLPIDIHFLELRGHGRSDGLRGHTNDFRNYHQDIYAWLDYLRDNSLLPSTKSIILFGHSLGGLIATDFLLHGKKSVTRAIRALALSSPAFGARTPLVKLKTVLNSKFFPKFLDDLYVPNNIDPRDLTHDRRVVKLYEEDPLVHGKITPAFFREYLSVTYKIHRKKKIVLNIPVLVLAGNEDHVVEFEAIERFVKRLDTKKKEFKVFPGFYHEVLNEKGNARVYSVLKKWTQNTIKGLD